MEQAPKRLKITQDIHIKPKAIWSWSQEGHYRMRYWRWVDGTYAYPCLACKRPTGYNFVYQGRYPMKKAPELCGQCNTSLWTLIDEAEWKDGVEAIWFN